MARAPVTLPATPVKMLRAGSAQPTQQRKSALLVLVETLVQRICGVRQFLQGHAGLGQGCGTLPQPAGGVGARRRVPPRRPMVEPQLAELARRLLEGRPALLLLRGQRQPGFERRQSRLAEGPRVLGARAPAL